MQIIISPTYSQLPMVQTLANIAAARGISTNSLMNSWRATDSSWSKENFAFYGDVPFCEYLAQELKYKLHSNALDWAAKLPLFVSKRSIRYMLLKDAHEERNDILGRYWIEPADNKKAFTAGVWTERLPQVPLDTPIIVSTDVEWQCRYRFIIINGEIATYCCYRIANVSNPEAIKQTNFIDKDRVNAPAYVNMILSNFETAPACVLDVGYSSEVGWSVIGTYPVWSSEMYSCDPGHFIRALFKACEPVK